VSGYGDQLGPTAGTVSLMTWLVMPRPSRALRGWLLGG
jgi:antibiotic biosynthesis monooxygenase (ABM) superfamily enzyme